MKPLSLRRRFFTNTTIVAVAVMTISMLIVDISYKKELEKSTREKLRLHIFTLLSVAQTQGRTLHVPDILHNPRFNTAGSGLWATVLDAAKAPLWRSLSIQQTPRDLRLGENTGDWRFGKSTINARQYLIAAYNVAWENNQRRYHYHFVVAEDESVLREATLRFRWWLFGGFFATTAALLLCQLIVLRLAFRPISHLEDEIALLEQGKQSTLSNDYPKELSGVTSNLNALIDKQYRQRRRYRASMADLAHSLKTPMAIINAEMTNYAENKILRDATTRIDNNIEYQLRRAVISGHTLLSCGTPVREILNLVLEALRKIYRDNAISVNAELDETLLFFGDENDLMEVLGNLLDNAYKHARRRINVAAKQCAGSLTIMIEDDGKGLSDNDAVKIFARGERLDRRGGGQGLGLAVVFDIVTAYRGHIETAASSLGGARFNITFAQRTQPQ